MLLHGDLVKLQAWRDSRKSLADLTPREQEKHWERVEKLSRSLRQSWLRVAEPIVLDDAAVELAAAWVDGAPVAVVATAAGDVGLLHLRADGLREGPRFRMHGFDSNTDEVRNILLSPRRYSREVDVFITVRRWPRGGDEPTRHLWRGILWRNDNDKDNDPESDAVLHCFRIVVERHDDDHMRWLEVDLSRSDDGNRNFLQWACDIPVQWSVDDALDQGLQPEGEEQKAILLALSADDRAWLEADGTLWHKYRGGERAAAHQQQITGRADASPHVGRHHPVAMALSDDGKRLVLANANGRLQIYSKIPGDMPHDPAPGMAAQVVLPQGTQRETSSYDPGEASHDLEAGVAVLAVVPQGARRKSSKNSVVTQAHDEHPSNEPPFDIIIAHRGGQLTRWRWVGPEKPLLSMWEHVVEECRKAWVDADAWRREINARSDVHAIECVQLLWLHAAWQDSKLLDAFCDPASIDGAKVMSVRVGQELVELLKSALGASKDDIDDFFSKALRIYRSGGLALREQVDRSLLAWKDSGESARELKARSLKNCWDHARDSTTESDGSVRRSAIANLATRHYLYEASWGLGARFVGAMSIKNASTGKIANHLIVAKDDKLISLALRDGSQPIDASLRGQDNPCISVDICNGSTLPLPWSWARSLHGGGMRHAAMLGGRGGMVLVRPGRGDAAGPLQAYMLPCVNDEVPLAAVNLKPPSPDRLHLGLVWAKGTRVRIQAWTVDLKAAELAAPREDGHELPIAARVLDVAMIDDEQWVAAGTRLPRLEWLRFNPAQGASGAWESVGPSMPLKSAVVNMRFADGWIDGKKAPVLLFTTQAGWLWCVDARRRIPLWLRHVGDSITVLDVSGVGENLRILVCASPQWWCLFDAAGGRLWRHEIGLHAAGAVMMPCVDSEASESPERLALIGDEGILSIFRYAAKANDRQYWLDVARSLEPSDTDPDQGRVWAAHLIATDRFDRIGQLHRDARRVLLAEAVNAGVDVRKLLEPHDHSASDVAMMARKLPESRPIADWKALWDYALALLDDDEQRSAQAEMLVELLTHLHRRGTPRAYLEERLKDIPDLRRDGKPGSIAEHREVAVQAAHAWIDAVSERRSLDADKILRHLHDLSPHVVQELPMFVPRDADGRLAPWLEALAHAAFWDDGKDGSYQFPSFLLGREGGDSAKMGAPTWPSKSRHHPNDSLILDVLGSAFYLVSADMDFEEDSNNIWNRVKRLLAASRRLPVGPGALVTALRCPGIQSPERFPEETWRLEQQRQWLVQALDRHWPKVASSADRTSIPGAMDRLMAVVEQRFRRGLEQQLARVVARTRPHLMTQVLRWTGDEVLLGLQFQHEGQRVLLRPDISLGLAVGNETYDPMQAPRWSWRPTQLAPDDRVYETRLALSTVGQRHLRLCLHCRTEGNDDLTEWPLDLGEPWHDETSHSPLLRPPLLRNLVQRIESLVGGVATLVLDTPLAPRAVVDMLVNERGMLPRDLDSALQALGPGRTYPYDLDLPAILRAIDGHDVRDRYMAYSMDYEPARWPHTGTRPLLLFPCEDLVRRLLEDPALQTTRDALWAGLRKRTQQPRGTPPWLWVLPASLAARWHAAMADVDAGWLHPACVAASVLDDESCRQALAEHLQVDERDLRSVLAEADYDLRLLGVAAKHREQAQRAFIQADLSGLSPRELVALLALAAARTELPLDRIPEGATSDENVASITAGPHGGSRRLVSAGEAGFDVRRLSQVRKTLRVRGIVDADEQSKKVPDLERRMLAWVGFDAALLRRLVRLRVVEQSRTLYHLRSDLASFLSRALAKPDWELRVRLLAQFRDENVLWHALHLPALARSDVQDLRLLRIAAPERRLPWLRAIGMLWQGQELTTVQARRLVAELTGKKSLNLTNEKRQYATVSLEVQLPDLDAVEIHLLSSTLPIKCPMAPSRTLYVWLGPACAGLSEAAGVRIGDAQMREILQSPRPPQAFWACLRTQTDSRQLSPFIESGSLPPGSRLFVGRHYERQQIKQGMGERSFLILGARRIGKTSLLHQVRHDAAARTDVLCLYVDAQGSDTPMVLARALRSAWEVQGMPSEVEDVADADLLLDRFQRHAREQRRMPVLLLNEIDGLLRQSPGFVQRLRARHESDSMRFVFTGYVEVRSALNDIYGPLYHFTNASSGSHFMLGALTSEDCRELIACLTREPLLLQWANEAQRARGEHMMVQASHRLPWLLQQLCGRLLAHMTGQRRSLIALEDVRQALAGQEPLLPRLEGFDMAETMGSGVGKAGDRHSSAEAARSGGQWVLHLLLAHVYGWGEGRQTRLDHMQRNPVDLGFSASQARMICEQTLLRLPLRDAESERVRAWLHHLPWKRFFDAVSLSLILGSDVRKGESIWYFQDHIYPGEWDRAEQRGVSLENRILDGVARLYDALI
jgi:hypothetical protein